MEAQRDKKDQGPFAWSAVLFALSLTTLLALLLIRQNNGFGWGAVTTSLVLLFVIDPKRDLQKFSPSWGTVLIALSSAIAAVGGVKFAAQAQTVSLSPLNIGLVVVSCILFLISLGLCVAFQWRLHRAQPVEG